MRLMKKLVLLATAAAVWLGCTGTVGAMDVICNGQNLTVIGGENAVLIAASYTADGRLNNTKLWNGADEGVQLDITDFIADENNKNVKFILFDAPGSMKPGTNSPESKLVRLSLGKDGCLSFEGVNTRKKFAYIPFTVRDEEGNIVFIEQLASDSNGHYRAELNIKDFKLYHRYTITTSDTERELYLAEYAENRSITACEDVGVIDGKYADTNFAEQVDTFSNKTILCKYNSVAGHMRKGYFKFDISDVALQGLKRVYFQYYFNASEKSDETLVMNLYAADADLWSENTLTYNTQPARGKYIGAASGIRNALGQTDITEYVLENFSDGIISFMAEGNDKSTLNQGIASREYENEAYRPKLVFCYKDDGVFTDYAEASYAPGVDPVANARKMIRESTAEYVYPEISAPHYDYSDYTDSVNAMLGTDSRYTARATRTLATISGFTAYAPRLDKYGGNIDEKVSDGTGYFDVIKLADGSWTLVDPLGNLFWTTGVTTVRPADSQAAYRDIIKNYGGDVNTWAAEKNGVLTDNGFNSAGAWSFLFRRFNPTTGSINSNMYFSGIAENLTVPTACLIPRGTAITYARGIGGAVGSGVEGFAGGVPPVFNPDFEEKCGAIIKQYTEGLQDCPNVIGWWSDNEINASYAMLDYALNLDPNNELYVYTHAAAWEWLRYRLKKNEVGLYDVNDELREEFREFVYDRYYAVMRRQFKKYAPNHLYLGSRHYETSVKSRGVFAAAARYCDVVSFNLYKYWTPDIVAEWAQYEDVPVLVTEFYSDKESVSGGWLVEDDESEGKFYENFMLRLLEADNVVGAQYQLFTAFDTAEKTDLHRSAYNINTYVYGLKRYFKNK